jgi:catechol 2,3-dioxygenase-like lactoylglutathione lyase family enzyme
MARGIDHIVHAVRDLDAAAALYRALGFQVGARNRHPPAWGTQNHIVQLPGTFIELLTVADPSRIAPHAPNFFSFGAFNRDFLTRGEGLAMLVLEGRGAADRDEFSQAGIGHFELYEFEREAKRPDGTPIKVAFALAYAASPEIPQIGFFTCQHRHPENFWNPVFQVHPNSAASVAGVVLVAKRPAEVSGFLSTFTGEMGLQTSRTGIAVKTPRGDIEVVNPASFEREFGEAPPDISASPRLAVVRFAVHDLGAASVLLQRAGADAHQQGKIRVIGPRAAMGATLVFEPFRGG